MSRLSAPGYSLNMKLYQGCYSISVDICVLRPSDMAIRQPRRSTGSRLARLEFGCSGVLVRVGQSVAWGFAVPARLLKGL